ncbi:partner and localizer of BRCA2 [Polyodon spathula]|uniref:partner and localizer of BRCA2 n=1 Tax=Polyodon spathula TaxID=7913 RepID=UPI001B7EFFBE|nr:partner and localizer of BRCA2 [Polyodon spathula]XP_041085568.1 partner and localizer of BRCA2 [Polyodon spathula]
MAECLKKPQLSCQERQKLKERLALLKREYSKTVQRLKRSERSKVVRNHVKSRIKEQNQLLQEENTNRSAVLGTLKEQLDSSLGALCHNADTDQDKKTTVTFNLNPEVISQSTSPLLSLTIQHSDSPVLESYSPGYQGNSSVNPKLKRLSRSRMQSKKSRFRWEEKNSDTENSGKGNEPHVLDSSESLNPDSPLLKSSIFIHHTKDIELKDSTTVSANACRISIFENSDAVCNENNSDKSISETSQGSPMVLAGINHYSSPYNEPLVDKRITDDRLPHVQMSKKASPEDCKHTEEDKELSGNNAGPIKAEVTSLPHNKFACGQTEPVELKVTDTVDFVPGGHSVEMGISLTEADSKIEEALADNPLSSCTLVEGLLFPVEYYVRTTRGMASCQRKVDLEAVIESQLGRGKRRSRGRPRQSMSSVDNKDPVSLQDDTTAGLSGQSEPQTCSGSSRSLLSSPSTPGAVATRAGRKTGGRGRGRGRGRGKGNEWRRSPGMTATAESHPDQISTGLADTGIVAAGTNLNLKSGPRCGKENCTKENKELCPIFKRRSLQVDGGGEPINIEVIQDSGRPGEHDGNSLDKINCAIKLNEINKLKPALESPFSGTKKSLHKTIACSATSQSSSVAGSNLDQRQVFEDSQSTLSSHLKQRLLRKKRTILEYYSPRSSQRCKRVQDGKDGRAVSVTEGSLSIPSEPGQRCSVPQFPDHRELLSLKYLSSRFGMKDFHLPDDDFGQLKLEKLKSSETRHLESFSPSYSPYITRKTASKTVSAKQNYLRNSLSDSVIGTPPDPVGDCGRCAKLAPSEDCGKNIMETITPAEDHSMIAVGTTTVEEQVKGVAETLIPIQDQIMIALQMASPTKEVTAIRESCGQIATLEKPTSAGESPPHTDVCSRLSLETAAPIKDPTQLAKESVTSTGSCINLEVEELVSEEGCINVPIETATTTESPDKMILLVASKDNSKPKEASLGIKYVSPSCVSLLSPNSQGFEVKSGGSAVPKMKSPEILSLTPVLTFQSDRDSQREFHRTSENSPTFPSLGCTPAFSPKHSSPMIGASLGNPVFPNMTSPKSNTSPLQEERGAVSQKAESPERDLDRYFTDSIWSNDQESQPVNYLENKREQQGNQVAYDSLLKGNDTISNILPLDESNIIAEEHQPSTPGLGQSTTQTLQLLSKLKTPAGSCLIDLCSVQWCGDSGAQVAQCVVTACESVVTLWGPQPQGQWTVLYTWTFIKFPVIQLVTFPDAPCLFCVALGKLEIREARVLGYSNGSRCFEQLVLCSGDIKAVLGMSRRRLVSCCDSLQSQKVELVSVSEEGRIEDVVILTHPRQTVVAFAEVEGEDEALIGTTATSDVVIWNMKTAQLLQRISLGEIYRDAVCLRSYSESGILYALLRHQYVDNTESCKGAIFKLVAINPMNTKSSLVQSLTLPAEYTGRYVASDVRGRSIAAAFHTGLVVVWDLPIGHCSAVLSPDCGGSWTLVRWSDTDSYLLTGQLNGDVSIYTYSGTCTREGYSIEKTYN